MDTLQNYGSSSGSDSDADNEDNTAHLKPVDSSISVAKSLMVVAAPDVVPMVSIKHCPQIRSLLHRQTQKCFYFVISQNDHNL